MEHDIVPIIKWAGGKRQLLDAIRPMLPSNYRTYYEPFFGGGALFCSIAPKKAVINDSNARLMMMYETIRECPETLCDDLLEIQHQYNERRTMQEKDEFYYRMRDRYNSGKERKDIAALLIFLNKSGFNGLYRVNAFGKYNVPSAHRKDLKIFRKENILALSKALSKARILCADFEEACGGAAEGDFIFFDPPYYGTFDKYQRGGFSESDHVRLSKLFRSLSSKGVFCMLTNNACSRIRELYDGFLIREIPVKRMINCDGSNRTGKEVIITNYGE